MGLAPIAAATLPGIGWLLGGAFAGAIVGLGAYTLVRGWDVGVAIAPSLPELSLRASSASTSGSRRPASRGPSTTDPPKTDGERLRTLLESSDGRMRQADIVDELGWSASKTSRVIAEMAEDGGVEKLRLGRENLVELADAGSAARRRSDALDRQCLSLGVVALHPVPDPLCPTGFRIGRRKPSVLHCPGTAPGMAPESSLDAATERAVEEYVASWMSEDGVPGASVALIDGTELTYAEGFGARDLAEDLPATPDTLFGIGSCTKSVVATAVLQCVERTDLDLDDPVSAYLPHLSEVPGDPVTVESLLNHTSGMPSDGNLSALVTRLTEIGDANTPLTSEADFRRHVQGSAEERYTEEAHFFYYNTGFALLGLLVADVTDTSFEEYVREHVFDPLGMERSCFTPERFEAAENRMSAYYEEADGEGTEWHEGSLGFSEPMYAPGGMASSVVETSRFLRMLLNGGEFEGERVLPSAVVDAMTTPTVTRYENVDGVERNYGYGLSIQSFLDDTLVGHGGMMGTTTAFVGYLEDAEVGVVVACNTAPAHHPTVTGHALLSILRGREPEAAVPRLALEAKAERLVGEYESYRAIQTASVERDGTTLGVEVDGRLGDRSMTLFPETADPDDLWYYTVSGDSRVPVTFLKTEEGTDMLLQRWRLHRQHE